MAAQIIAGLRQARTAEAAIPPFHEFLARQVWIDDAGGTKLTPWAWQQELAEAIPDIPRLAMLKARQTGMTWFFAAYSLHTALQAGAKCLLFSQTEDDAKGFKARAQFIYDRMPVEEQRKAAAWNKQVLAFPDLQSYLKAFPSTARAGRGTSAARLAIFDEYAFHSWALDTMSAVAPSIESNPEGQLFILSTANGVGNAFHVQWQAATKNGWVEPYWDGETWRFGDRLKEARRNLAADGWMGIFIPYFARPGRNEEWRERQRNSATYVANPSKLEQEHPRDANEAFVQTGRPVFAKADLDRQKFRDPLPRVQWPEAFSRFHPDELHVFALPEAGKPYRAGADVAEGLEHGDFSDLCVLDGDDFEVLSFHGHWTPDVFAGMIDTVARTYPGIYGIERNNHGLTVLTECDKHLRTPGLYRERVPFDPRGVAGNAPGHLGWLTSSVSKPIMIDELEQAIRLDGIHLSDRLALSELTFYQTKPNGSTGAPDGAHDDRVISRAIAWQMRKKRRTMEIS